MIFAVDAADDTAELGALVTAALEAALALVLPLAVAEAEAVAVAEAPAPKLGRKLGLYEAVPTYAAQPGTVVLGGARPPPQSRGAQISPVPGT